MKDMYVAQHKQNTFWLTKKMFDTKQECNQYIAAQQLKQNGHWRMKFFSKNKFKAVASAIVCAPIMFIVSLIAHHFDIVNAYWFAGVMTFALIFFAGIMLSIDNPKFWKD